MPARSIDGVTVRVSGLREAQKAFKKISGELGPGVRAALREAAWPVARSIRALEAGNDDMRGASINTIGPKVTLAGAAVTQRKTKVTGARPDFGALQMREAFIPGLEQNIGEVTAAAELALDHIIEGF